MSIIDDFLKNNGFIIPSNEIYGGCRGLYDYGHLGVLLKRNIQKAWEDFFVIKEPRAYFLDATILGTESVWKASGHVDNFNDVLVDCKNCKKRFREDHLPEDKKCPSCKSLDWTDPRPFNLIFKTNEDFYLRPETAQSIFINFKNVQRIHAAKIPFAVCQVGKAFRNEITLSNSIFRTKEFEQMECEWFVSLKDSDACFDRCTEKMREFLVDVIGISTDKIQFIDIPEEDRAHYSRRSMDVNFLYEHGWGELWGLANRGTFDLSAHQQHSGKSMEYLDTENNNEKYVPAVVEHSIGLNRLMYAIVTAAYNEEPERIVLKLNPKLSPYKFAVLPLTKGEIELATVVYEKLLQEGISTIFLKKGSIGKRYKKNDEIGTPYCITIDQNSRLSSESNPQFTIRDRDTTKQIQTDWETLKKNEFRISF